MIGLYDLNWNSVPEGLIEVEIKRITRRMKMSIVVKGSDEEQYECNIILLHSDSKQPVIVTPLGIYGLSFARFICNYLNIRPTNNIKEHIITKIIFDDDYDVDLDTGKPIYKEEINNDKLINDNIITWIKDENNNFTF